MMTISHALWTLAVAVAGTVWAILALWAAEGAE